MNLPHFFLQMEEETLPVSDEQSTICEPEKARPIAVKGKKKAPTRRKQTRKNSKKHQSPKPPKKPLSACT